MKWIKLFGSIFSRYRIYSICKRYDISNYTINPDGTVDVDGDVFLFDKGLKKLPLKFGVVSGYFWCDGNQLTTLEGAPNRVGRDFVCFKNKLTTLEGGPKEVGGKFYCQGNKLTTLEGAPKEVGGDFWCARNKLTTLEGFPKEIGGDFICDGNPIHNIYKLYPDYDTFIDSMETYNYLRGTNIVRGRFIEAMEDINRKIPNYIFDYEII